MKKKATVISGIGRVVIGMPIELAYALLDLIGEHSITDELEHGLTHEQTVMLEDFYYDTEDATDYQRKFN